MLPRPLQFVLGVALMALSFSMFRGDRAAIVWEAESYSEIAAPMVIARGVEAASNDTAVSLPLGSGQGWRGKGTGSVRYRIEVPADGEYTLWARTLWQDGCTNAVYVRMNGGERRVLGNDAVFGQWHWVKDTPVALSRGVNFVELANHSDGIVLDKFVLTNVPRYEPEGLGAGITRFYDGFAGCDADNTGSWSFESGNWKVLQHNDDAASTANDCLAQWDPKGGMALTGLDSWRDYGLRAMVSMRSAGRAGVFFYYRGEHEYGRLTLIAGQQGARFLLEWMHDGAAVTLAEAPVHLAVMDAWYTLGIEREEGKLVATLDGAPVLTAEFQGTAEGRAGLFSQECSGALFDNVDVTFNAIEKEESK